MGFNEKTGSETAECLATSATCLEQPKDSVYSIPYRRAARGGRRSERQPTATDKELTPTWATSLRNYVHIPLPDLRWGAKSLIFVKVFLSLIFHLFKIIAEFSKCFFWIPGTKLRGIRKNSEKNIIFSWRKLILKIWSQTISVFFWKSKIFIEKSI